MSQATPVLDKTYLAAGDLSTKQYTGVILSAEYTVTTAGANAVAIGVQQDLPAAAGRGCRVRHLGTSKVLAGAAFAAGAQLKTDAAGAFIAASTGQNAPCIALEAALAAGDIVEALVMPGATVA